MWIATPYVGHEAPSNRPNQTKHRSHDTGHAGNGNPLPAAISKEGGAGGFGRETHLNFNMSTIRIMSWIQQATISPYVLNGYSASNQRQNSACDHDCPPTQANMPFMKHSTCLLVDQMPCVNHLHVTGSMPHNNSSKWKGRKATLVHEIVANPMDVPMDRYWSRNSA